MGQAPRELSPRESSLHLFGAELRHWRTLRGLSQAAVGRLSHDSSALIGKIEKGQRYPSRAIARRLDGVLETEGALMRLWPRVERERVARSSSGRQAEGGEDHASDLGLEWTPTPDEALTVLGDLWRAELNRRSLLSGVGWAATAFAVPTREWLRNRTDGNLEHHTGYRRVGRVDVDALWSMCGAFTDTDHRLGGGYARITLVHYLDHVVFPLLQGSYSDRIGRELMTATARLCNLCAFMSFDSGHQGLAQRYFIQALRLAQAGGNRGLGAHILADMSMQAHYVGDVGQALALADAGYRSGHDAGSPSTTARCAAMQGRAHALGGDRQASDKTRVTAERILNGATPAAEPVWIRFFTAAQMSAEFLYMAEDLDRRDEVQQLAPEVLASSGSMQRRQALTTTALAASYLPAETPAGGDVDRACELLIEVLPTVGSLTSNRTMARVNSLRRALSAHARRPAVQELEHRFGCVLTDRGMCR